MSSPKLSPAQNIQYENKQKKDDLPKEVHSPVHNSEEETMHLARTPLE